MTQDHQFDAIVIGAGLGGLSCALHLAKRGMKVCVVEKQPKVGGYAQNYRRNGYDFDVSLHLLPAMNETGGLHRLLDYLQVLPKLQVTEHTPMFTSIFGKDKYQLRGGTDAAAYLKDQFPRERAGIDKFVDTMTRIVTSNTNLFWSGELDVDNFFPATYFKRTYKDLLDEHFSDYRLKGVLDQLWQSAGLPSARIAANWAAEVFGSHLLTGNYYIQGGGGHLSNAMAQTLEEAGGEVRTGALVRQIVTRERQVQGVVLDSGEELRAQIVVANVSPLQTYLELIGKEKLAKPFCYKLDKMETSLSLITLYLGLDVPGKEAGLTDHTTFHNRDYDTERAFKAGMAEQFAQTDYLVSDYTDPQSGSHPEKGGIAQILEVANGPAWTNITRAQYLEKKARVTETILEKVGRAYPHLARHINVLEVGTPRTMALATRNPGGCVYGWAQIPSQADNWRFAAAGLFSGLFFTGSWSRGGGGGYMGTIVNGRVTAQNIFSRTKWTHQEIRFKTRPIKQNTTKSPKAQQMPHQLKISLTQADLSEQGELKTERAVALLNQAANACVGTRTTENSSQASVTFFQMRFAFVPFVRLHPGATVRIDTAFEPTATPKGQVTQSIVLEKENRKLAHASGLVILR